MSSAPLEITLYNQVLPYFTKAVNLKTDRVVKVGNNKFEFRVYQPINAQAHTSYEREVMRLNRDRIIEIITPVDSRRIIYYHHKQQLLEVLDSWQPYIVGQTAKFLTEHIPYLRIKSVSEFKIDSNISLDYAEPDYIVNLRPDNPPARDSNSITYVDGDGWTIRESSE